MKPFFTVFFLALLSIGWSQNCNVTIDLNPEVNLCGPGSSVLLPVISGDYESFTWSPITGLDDPNQLITTANVTDSTVYTLNVLSLSDDNLITNGDFSAGDTGFTSDYIYGTGGGVGLLSNEGQYAIATNAGTTHNQFANCNDHTGGGNMMVVNASGDASNIWCQNITVDTDTDYFFSAWVTSVTSQNPAQLQFSVNGVQLGSPFNASANTCNWQQFSAEWSSGTTTAAEICVVNTNFTPAGNDFALDDISFQAYCTTTASVAINVTELVSDVVIPNQICGAASTIDPNNYLSANADTGGTWTLDGSTINTFDPATLANGVHTLEYTISTNSCSSSSDGQFTLASPPDAGSPGIFTTCINPGDFAVVELSTLVTNEDLGGQWEYFSGPNTGTLLVNGNATQLSTSTAGSYTFIYTVDGGGVCPSDTTYQSFDINLNPIADLPATATLDCIIRDITLVGANTSTGNNIVYQWSQNNIPFVSQFDISLEVDEPGTYRLIVRDENTNCFAEAITEVDDLSGDFSFSLTTVPAPCLDPDNGAILIENITGGTPPFLASIDGENFAAVDQFSALAPGDYTVQLQDAGGCEEMENANLSEPSNPMLELQSNQEEVINLGESVTISVISNPPLELLDTLIWFPPLPDSLQISNKQWAVQPELTTNYTLLIRDLNGCEAEASLLVTVRPEGAFYVPNAISPNEDGTNDRFVIYDKGSIANITTMRIFDRWGALVYEVKDLAPNSSDRAWNGRYNGDLLPSGLYIYAAELEWINGTTSQIQGEISIVY
jgi:gliding motility-associated-like protein